MLLDAAGRQVMSLWPGPNDVGHLSPGVYCTLAQFPCAATKVIITR